MLLIDLDLVFFSSPAAISHFLRHDPSSPILAGIAAYAAFWLFVTGGILDRFARGRPIFTAAFFAACGVYFARFLRLAVFIGAAYFILFRWLYPLLFETLFGLFVSDVSTDRDLLWLRGLLYGVFAAALVAVDAVADFAKVRAVVEDRRAEGSLALSPTRHECPAELPPLPPKAAVPPAPHTRIARVRAAAACTCCARSPRGIRQICRCTPRGRRPRA